MRLPADQRKARVVGSGLLSEAQYSKAISIASQIPVLHVEKAFFKVIGERFVTPSSLVQFVIKCRFVPPGAQHVPAVKPADLEDIDPDEGDLAAITGRKDDRSGEKPIQPPLAHAPYYARDHAPRWFVFLADSKQGKIAVPPFTFQTFDKPILDESGKPTYNVQTLKAQFGAPPQPGSYTFVMHMVCDSYIGMDTKQEITLVVEDANKAEEMEEDGEISEPDEGKSRSLSFRIDALNISMTDGCLQILLPGRCERSNQAALLRARRRSADRKVMMIQVMEVILKETLSLRAKQIPTLTRMMSKGDACGEAPALEQVSNFQTVFHLHHSKMVYCGICGRLEQYVLIRSVSDG